MRKPVSCLVWTSIRGIRGAFREANTSATRIGQEPHIFYTHIRINSLLLGVLMAYCYRFVPQVWVVLTRRPWLLMAISVSCITPVLVFDRETTPFVWTGGYTLLYLGFGSLLVVTMAGRSNGKQPTQHISSVESSAVSVQDRGKLLPIVTTPR